jgi:outer membrane protein assembly factor BamD (BamD/ComL family)
MPEDLKQASQESWCAKDLLQLISESLDAGEVEKAKQHSIDLTKSLHELSKLADKKRIAESYAHMLRQMDMQGDLIRRYFFER